jgi:diguanylate cyclase (GGDEF)-like protein
MVIFSRRPQRRTDDGRWAARVVARLFGATDTIDAVLLGRVLLVVAGVIVIFTVPLLDPDGSTWARVFMVSAAMAAGLLASFVVPWPRLGSRATLAFPVLVCAALIAMSTAEIGVFAPLTGLISLCFAYLGLTQPPGTTFVMLPFAALTFFLTNGSWSWAIAIRLSIGCWVWVLLGELLSRFTARQAALSAALRTAAHTDALTGVANRRDLDLRLAVARPGDMVVLCDLDHFKALNDSRGHYVGDRVLADFGSMLRATLRADDYCARYGGEEFVLVLAGTSRAQAEATLGRMRAHWAVLQPATTFSAGLASVIEGRPHAETLAAADRALYAAKAAGRNCDRGEPSLVDLG